LGGAFHGSSDFTIIHQMINLPEFTAQEITKRTSAGKVRSNPAALPRAVCCDVFTRVHQIVDRLLPRHFRRIRRALGETFAVLRK
jgi:hypothetical protein